MQVDKIIDCIDCGSPCHLLSYPDEDGEYHPGEIVSYRCEDCLDCWYLVIPDPDHPEDDGF